MIGVLATLASNHAAQLVLAALRRSVTFTQARLISLASLETNAYSIIVAISPTEAFGEQLLDWLSKGQKKLILFGDVPLCLEKTLGFEHTEWPSDAINWSRSEPAALYSFSESTGVIQYSDLTQMLAASNWRRPMERFDLMEEWNNLGYGAIRMDVSGR